LLVNFDLEAADDMEVLKSGSAAYWVGGAVVNYAFYLAITTGVSTMAGNPLAMKTHCQPERPRVPLDKREDELLDTFCYGIAIALGNNDGF
jgi:hypothetical protein